MRLRIILIVLSLLAFLSVSTAGYLYHASLIESEVKEAEKDAALQAARIRSNLSSFLSENLKTVKLLAGLREMRQALASPGARSLAGANTLLDHAESALSADVCYLMDLRGNTVASSNRNEPDSFVGKNFSFRPYWREAVGGTPATYMALGVASNVRGVYFSHAVRGDKAGAAAGVVVIKTPVERIEAEFRHALPGIVLLADPHGIVFVSNRKEWLYRSLRPLDRDEAEELVRSQQFGPGPWEWIGMDIGDGKSVTDRSGRKYLAFRMKVDAHPGWSLIYLRDFKDISRAVSGALIDATGSIVLALCVLIGVSVFYLYRRANADIIRRREAERALEEAKGELARYSRDLERKVRDRTREITRIMMFTPAIVYIKDKDGRYSYVNPRFEELFGITTETIRGKSYCDVFPKEFAERFEANDRKVVADRGPCQVEERVPLPDGLHAYLSTKFPIYDEEGRVVAVCGISIDITEIKRAQDQMRRLSDSILAGQEKERAAISRELHDELGQVLTALRLDAAWLRDRTKDADAGAAAQAQAMCDVIDRAIDDVRGMATRLRPGALDRLGLVEALDWYVGDFEKRTKIACAYRHDGSPRIDDRTATAAYRIAQESLTNVVRHSFATRVEVFLRADDEVMELTVGDNGRGFDTRELPGARGLGVAGMRERAGLVGGTLDIASSPGGGTTIRLRIPLGHRNGAVH